MKLQIQIFVTMEEEKITTWQTVYLKTKKNKAHPSKHQCWKLQCTYYDAIHTLFVQFSQPNYRD